MTKLKIKMSTIVHKEKMVFEGLISVSKFSSETFLKIIRVHVILDSILFLLHKLEI